MPDSSKHTFDPLKPQTLQPIIDMLEILRDISEYLGVRASWPLFGIKKNIQTAILLTFGLVGFKDGSYIDAIPRQSFSAAWYLLAALESKYLFAKKTEEKARLQTTQLGFVSKSVELTLSLPTARKNRCDISAVYEELDELSQKRLKLQQEIDALDQCKEKKFKLALGLSFKLCKQPNF